MQAVVGWLSEPGRHSTRSNKFSRCKSSFYFSAFKESKTKSQKYIPIKAARTDALPAFSSSKTTSSDLIMHRRPHPPGWRAERGRGGSSHGQPLRRAAYQDKEEEQVPPEPMASTRAPRGKHLLIGWMRTPCLGNGDPELRAWLELFVSRFVVGLNYAQEFAKLFSPHLQGCMTAGKAG